MGKDSKLALGDRMKSYEAAHDLTLPPRLPIIIRVDGKAFHTWTRGLEKPHCGPLMLSMANAAILICETIQGACFAYSQSDEISVLVHGYRTHESQPPFGNRLQKLCSIAASCAAAQLTRDSYAIKGHWSLALFDARVYVVPESDVANYFLWRQRDAERNSIQGLAQSLASHREIHGLNTKQLQELCFQRGTNWNDLPVCQKRGFAVYRNRYSCDGTERTRMVCDYGAPRFGDDRWYIERWLTDDPYEDRVDAAE